MMDAKVKAKELVDSYFHISRQDLPDGEEDELYYAKWCSRKAIEEAMDVATSLENEEFTAYLLEVYREIDKLD